MDSAIINQTIMIHSTDTKDIFTALVNAQSEMPSAPKDATNPHFRSKYATLQSIVETSLPVLKKYGLGIVQTFQDNCDGISITTTLVHNSGQFISGTLHLKPTKNDPQGYGSAITYGRRYAWAAMIGMVADEDDDGNAASAPVTKPATRPAPPSGNDPDDNKPWIDGNNDRWLKAMEHVKGKGEEEVKKALAHLGRDFKINKTMREALRVTGLGLTAHAADANQ